MRRVGRFPKIAGHVAGDDLDPVAEIQDLPQRVLPVGQRVGPHQTLAAEGAGQGGHLVGQAAGVFLRLGRAQHAVQGEDGEHLGGHLVRDMAHGPLLQVAPVVGQGAAGALQRLAEGLLRQGAAGMLRHKSGHLPQLLRHIGHRLRRILPGHIHGEWGTPHRWAARRKGELIGVARQRGAEHEAGRRHHAALRQAQQNLMIGAVALRYAVVLGGGDKRRSAAVETR